MKTVSRVLVIVPVLVILLLSCMLFLSPSSVYESIASMRVLIGDKLSSYYLILGLSFILIILGVSFSKYGNIKLGDGEPEYSTFAWGSMIFTSTMAADIVFYSFHEWSYYYQGSTLEEAQLSSATYPLFHWGPIPWAFYILPAMAYAYQMYKKNVRVYRLSQATGIPLRIPVNKFTPRKREVLIHSVIDIFSLLAMLAAAATTFSLATPLMAEALCSVLGIESNTSMVSIIVLSLIALTYIVAVMSNMEGISLVAKGCVFVFLYLSFLILVNSNIQYTIETSLTGLGNMINNFFRLSTETGSLRLASSEGNSFTQDYTVFYWSYWISWSLCTPLFIARISKGRTLRNIGIGALISGVAGTFVSFLVYGNFGLYQQVSGNFDMVGKVNSGASYSSVIVELIESQTMFPTLILFVLFMSMLMFYTSTFDTLTLVMSQYVCKTYQDNPPKYLKVFWGVLFILLPIALLFTEGTLESLKSLSIIASLPISLVFIRIIYVFLRDLKRENL